MTKKKWNRPMPDRYGGFGCHGEKLTAQHG